jgi:hypothetical protein
VSRTTTIDLKFRCNITWFQQKKWAGAGGGGSDFKVRDIRVTITAARRTDERLSYKGQRKAQRFSDFLHFTFSQAPSKRHKKLGTKRCNEFLVLLLVECA